MKRPARPWIGLAVILVVAAVILGIAFARGSLRRGSASREVPVEAIALRTITVTIEATGVVEPIDLVEVKSKASGQILRMPVEVGSHVHAHDLLAQIDTVDVQNQYEQSLAAKQAAQARSDISDAQKKRSDILFAQNIITADEHETAVLDHANAQAALVKARTDLDSARQRRDDATVRAPITGTILEQLVSTGQVISSATSSVSGGTSLLKMADLSRIRLRAYVSETDIGSVRAGQEATVTFEAFSRREFPGTVEKIEPQAIVQQSVTMFPVLISISNEDGLLLPGMNGDLTMVVDRCENVPAVPLDAVRTMREAQTVGAAIGLDPQQVLAQLRRGASGRGFGGSGSPGAGMGGSSGSGGSLGRAGGSGSSGGQVAFVRTATGFEPRVVHLGLSDFDYAQVLSGLQEGEEVALLSIAEVQEKRTSDQQQLQQRLGNGIPGSSTGSTRTRTRSATGTTGGTTRSTTSGSGGGNTPPPPPGGP
jgi:HlyD family secretion protein